MKLTPQQKRFADEYIISSNIYNSLIKAGYSKNYAKSDGCKILEYPSVKEYIQKRINEIDNNNDTIAKQEEVLKYLTSVIRGESESSVVVIEGLGNGINTPRLINKPPDEKERLKAAELLGKRYKLFTDKVDLDTTVDMDLNITIDYGACD